MKINKDYRHHIGTHANSINRATSKRNQNTKAASPNAGLQKSLPLAKTMLTMATLANVISVAKGTEEHDAKTEKRKNSSPTLNPRFLLHNAMRFAAAFGQENDVHAHLPKKPTPVIPTFSSPATDSKVSIATYQDIWQLRASPQTAQPMQVAAMINQTAHQRAVRQARATPIATTSSSNVRPVVLTEINAVLEKAMPKLLIEYINQLDPFHQYQEIEPALMGYIAHLSKEGKAAKAIFQDTQLQQVLCQQLGLDCSHEANIYVKNLMSTLLHTIVEKFDFSQVDNGVSYNGYAFQGLQENSLFEAKQKSLQFIQRRIAQKVPHLDTSTTEKAAALLLKTVDPLLARIQAGDPLVNKIHYCDHQCGLLSAGIEFVAQIVGDEADHYTLQGLIDIGRDYLKQSVPAHATPTAIVDQLNTHQALSIRDRILLKKASADGVTVDLTQPIETKQQLQAFLHTQKDHHALIKAQHQLAQPIPTRHLIAQKILEEKGLDPNQGIAYVDKSYSGRGGEDPTVSYIPLTEAYMSKDARKPTYDSDRAILNGLPDLDQKFADAFKTYSDTFNHALSNSLQLQLQKLLSKDKANQASFKLFNANIHYVASRYNDVSTYSTGSRPNYASQTETEAFFLEMKNPDGSAAHFVFTKQQIDKGLQHLPENTSLEAWALAHQAQIIGAEAFHNIKTTHQNNAITRYKMTGGSDQPISISMTEIATGSLTDITTKAAGNFVDNNIKTLRDQAYEKTELQTENDFLKDFFRCQPFLQEIFCDNNWEQRTQHYLEDMASFVLPALFEAKLVGTEASLIEREAETLATKIQTSVRRPKPFLANSLKNEIASKHPTLTQKLANTNSAITNQASPSLSQSGHIRVVVTPTGKQLLNQQSAALYLQDYAVQPSAEKPFHPYSSSESIYTDAQNFYVKINNKYYPIDTAENGVLYIARPGQAPLMIEQTGNEWHLSLTERPEQALKETDTQRQTDQRYQSALVSLKSRHSAPVEDSTQIEAIPGYHADLSSIQLKELFLKDSTNLKQKAVLAKRISQVEQEELRNAALNSVLRHRKTFKNTNSLPVLMPQAFVLSIAGDNSGGRCYPLVNLMALAVIDGKTQQLNNKFFLAAADPEHAFINTLKELHATLRINKVSLPVSGKEARLDQIISRMTRSTAPNEMFAMDTPTHSMLIGMHHEQGHKIFSFFDPNFGLVSYQNKASFQKEIAQYLANKNYGLSSLNFRLLQLDKIRSFHLSGGHTIGQLLN